MFAIAWAWAGQVAHREVSLDDVLLGTSAAVIVRFGPKVSVPVELPIPSGVGKACGTYRYGVTEATVERVLLPPSVGPSLGPGELLAVYPADTGALIALSTLACDTGDSESPIFSRFAGITPVAGGTAIALLRWEPPFGWVEAASESWLPVGRAGEVVRPRDAFERVIDPGTALLCRSDAECTRASLDCGACAPCPDASAPPQHRLATRYAGEVCAATRAAATPPDLPAPNCEACPAPSGPPSRPPICRAMRCVEPSP